MGGNLCNAEDLHTKHGGERFLRTYLSDAEINQAVVDLVKWARVSYGIDVTCDAYEACAKISLDLQHKPLDGPDGLYVEDKKLVVINSNVDLPSREAFTIYHEITHHLLVEDGDLFSYLHDCYGNDEEAFTKAIERCCNIGASEFLIPQSVVKAQIVEHGLTVELVSRFSTERGASLIAAAIQLGVCAPVQCFVIIGAYGPVPYLWPTRNALYAEYVSWPSKNQYPLGRYTVFPSDHLFTQASHAHQLVRDKTYIPRRDGQRNWLCEGEATRIGSRVVGLLKIDEYIRQPPNQLGLNI